MKNIYFVIIGLLSSFATFANQNTYFLAADIDSSHASIDDTSDQIIRAKLDLGIEVDLASFLGEDSSLYASYSLRRGDNGSDFVGDMQSFSNIDEEEFSRLYELFFTKSMSDSSNLKLGVMDATADFAAPYNGGDFINASMGFSPTIGGISTYPTPHLGVYYDLAFAHYKLKLGAYSADEDRIGFSESFQIAEFEMGYSEESYLRFGLWSHTALENREGTLDSAGDFYAVIDHKFNDKLNGFFQYGNADSEFNDIETHWAIGVNYTGLFFADEPSGLVMSQISVDGSGQETAIEFYSNYTVNEHVSVKPSLVYISELAGDSASGDATIFNLRFSLAL